MAGIEIKELRMRLRALLKKEALKRGRFILSSGKRSNYYLDGRIITLSSEGAYLVAKILLEIIRKKKIDAIGGPTLGADPIVGAIAVLSYINKKPMKTFIVRKLTKTHGMQRQIEGPALKRKSRVVLVDDVATTGKSLIQAKKILEKKAIKVECAIVVVDREEGAKQNLNKAGMKLTSIFTVKDLGL